MTKEVQEKLFVAFVTFLSGIILFIIVTQALSDSAPLYKDAGQEVSNAEVYPLDGMFAPKGVLLLVLIGSITLIFISRYILKFGLSGK